MSGPPGIPFSFLVGARPSAALKGCATIGKQHSGTLARSAGFTLVELLIVFAIVGVLAAIGVAGYRLARLRSAEAATIAALDAINQAQFAYFQTCGKQRYAPSLTALGTPIPGGDPFLSPDLTSADVIVKSGYQIQMDGPQVTDIGTTCSGATPVETYQVTADPVTPGSTGMRFFGSNTDRVIFEDSATFTGNMPLTGRPSHGEEIR